MFLTQRPLLLIALYHIVECCSIRADNRLKSSAAVLNWLELTKRRKNHPQAERGVRVKNKNQYFSEVFSELLKKWCKAEEGRTQTKFAQAVGIHPNMISRYKKGNAYPTDDVMDWIATALDVDKSVFFPNKIQNAVEKTGEWAIDPKMPEKLERLSRIAELAETFQKLKNVYGTPDGWSERPLADGAAFIMYLDEQIKHAFDMYFKYLNAGDNT